MIDACRSRCSPKTLTRWTCRAKLWDSWWKSTTPPPPKTTSAGAFNNINLSNHPRRPLSETRLAEAFITSSISAIIVAVCSLRKLRHGTRIVNFHFCCPLLPNESSLTDCIVCVLWPCLVPAVMVLGCPLSWQGHPTTSVSAILIASLPARCVCRLNSLIPFVTSQSSHYSRVILFSKCDRWYSSSNMVHCWYILPTRALLL